MRRLLLPCSWCGVNRDGRSSRERKARGWFRKRPASPRQAVVAGALGALLFGGWALMHHDRNQHLGDDALVTQAIVLEAHQSRTSRVVIRFETADGDMVEAETEEFMGNPFPGAGDRVTVRYHPDDPEYYVRDVRWSGGWLVPGCVAFALGFLRWVLLGARGKVPPEIRFLER